MFDETHYVPVLRWKAGERGALRDLSASDRQLVTPLIELLPGHMKPRRAKHGPITSDDLWIAVEQLVDTWGPLPLFLDASKVHETPYKGSRALNVVRLFSAVGAAGLHVIPTTSLDQPPGVQEAVREAAKIDNRGVALRVPISYLAEARFTEVLRRVCVPPHSDAQSLAHVHGAGGFVSS